MVELPDLPELPKVYIYCTSVWRSPEGRITDYAMVAVAEDGEALGYHVCSHPSFAMGDLHNQPSRRAAYHDKFGGWGPEYYQVVQVPFGADPPAELIELIRQKNAEADTDESTKDGDSDG